MPRSSLIRAAQLVMVCLLLTASLGATDAAARFDNDSHKMMCVCGCAQLLGECNHVGCPDSEGMRAELTAAIAHGDSDDQIFRSFQQKYGAVVLAAPMFTSFNHLAWIMPPLVLFLGIGATLLIVRKWKLRVAPEPAAARSFAYDPLRERIRRETEL